MAPPADPSWPPADPPQRTGPHQPTTGGSPVPDPRRKAVHHGPRSEAFNRHPLDRRDPGDLLGTHLDGFAVNLSLPLTAQAARASDHLQADVLGRVALLVNQKFARSVEGQHVAYDDARIGSEAARHFLFIRNTTARGTRITTLFRCQVTGFTLYVAADSYLLPAVSPVRMVRWALVLILPFFVLTQVLSTTEIPSVVATLLIAMTIPLTPWLKVVRGAVSGHTGDSLRSAFPKVIRESTFDLDDSLTHLKTFVPTVAEGVRLACEAHGMDMRTADEIITDSIRSIPAAGPTIINNGNNYGILGGNLPGAKNTIRKV